MRLGSSSANESGFRLWGPLELLAVAGIVLMSACGGSNDNNGQSPSQGGADSGQTPSQGGADSSLCSSLSQLQAAVNTARDLDANSSLSEISAAFNDIKTAADQVVTDARNSKDAKTEQIQASADELKSEISSVSSGQSPREVVQTIKVNAQKLQDDIAAKRNDLKCK